MRSSSTAIARSYASTPARCGSLPATAMTGRRATATCRALSPASTTTGCCSMAKSLSRMTTASARSRHCRTPSPAADRGRCCSTPSICCISMAATCFRSRCSGARRRWPRCSRPVAGAPGPIQLSDHILGRGAAFAGEACRMGLEGIVSKRDRRALPLWPQPNLDQEQMRRRRRLRHHRLHRDESRGRAGRRCCWLPTAKAGSPMPGAPAAAFPGTEAEHLEAALRPLIRSKPAVTVPPVAAGETVHWVEPHLVAEINFANRTSDGLLRQARYKGLRPDLAAAEGGSSSRAGGSRANKSEAVAAPPEPPPVAKPRLVSDADLATIWVTNPERSMFGRDGATKLDLALYYARVGDWMLPEIMQPAGQPCPLPDRRSQRLLLPAPRRRRDAAVDQAHRTARGAGGQARRLRLSRRCPRPSGPGSVRRRRVSPLGLSDRPPRAAGPDGLRPRPGRVGALARRRRRRA